MLLLMPNQQQQITHTHTHLSGEPMLARCPINFPSFPPRLCILPGQTKCFNILFDTIPPCLPRASRWFSSFHFYCCATFNPVSISLCSTWPNHLNLPFLITKLTGSNPNSSLNHQIISIKSLKSTLNTAS